MDWNDLSDKAKSIIEWCENPYTNKKETVEIKEGSIFHRDCPKLCGNFDGDDLVCDILVTKELYWEVLNYVAADENIQYSQFADGRLVFGFTEEKITLQ
jgi:hypothetical protein